MQADDRHELIEAFLDGQLAAAEANDFAQKMAADPALARLVEDHRLLRLAQTRLEEKALFAKFDEWENEPTDGPTTEKVAKTRPFWPFLMVLAGAAALGFWLFSISKKEEKSTPAAAPPPVLEQPKSQPAPLEPTEKKTDESKKFNPEIAEKQPASRPANPQVLAAAGLQNFGRGFAAEAREAAFIRGDAAGDDVFFRDGLAAFEKGDAATAQENLEKIGAASEHFGWAQGLLADLFFSKKDFRRAAEHFEKYAELDPSPKTDWLLANFYLGDYERFKSKFWTKIDAMIDPKAAHPFAREAQKLASEMSGRRD